MPNLRRRSLLLPAALGALVNTTAFAADGGGAAKLSIDHIDLKPTKNGFYDATVGLSMADPKLGKAGAVVFSLVVPDVHDADEAITKVHEPVKTLSDDLQAGYRDLHREP